MDFEDKALLRAEKYGITEYKVVKDCMVYYSYFGSEGICKVIHNLISGEETRKHLNYKKIPKHLSGKINYYCG